MSNFKLSTRSIERLSSCHQVLRHIIYLAINHTEVDFAITQGHRTAKEQYALFKAGKSKKDGKERKSKHQTYPSEALDFAPIVNGKAVWDHSNCCYVAGVIMGLGDWYIHDQGEPYKLRWGGNWDSDGTIITDQNFIDLPHIELIRLK
ncbi:MAG: M15 family metallopeptidase [Cytophagales bacterium]|nr:M15 family metallopeptidase [Cytophagales bacterium]